MPSNFETIVGSCPCLIGMKISHQVKISIIVRQWTVKKERFRNLIIDTSISQTWLASTRAAVERINVRENMKLMTVTARTIKNELFPGILGVSCVCLPRFTIVTHIYQLNWSVPGELAHSIWNFPWITFPDSQLIVGLVTAYLQNLAPWFVLQWEHHWTQPRIQVVHVMTPLGPTYHPASQHQWS